MGSLKELCEGFIKDSSNKGNAQGDSTVSSLWETKASQTREASTSVGSTLGHFCSLFPNLS